ncbi:hypothetical protein ACLKA7_003540 [Drosophila subpalustris]
MTSSGPASKTPAAVARMTFRLLPSSGHGHDSVGYFAGHSVRDKKDILRFAFVALDSPHSHSAVLLSQNCTSLPISWTNNAHDRWPVSPFARTSLDLVCIECGPKDPCPCPSPFAL